MRRMHAFSLGLAIIILSGTGIVHAGSTEKTSTGHFTLQMEASAPRIFTLPKTGKGAGYRLCNGDRILILEGYGPPLSSGDAVGGLGMPPFRPFLRLTLHITPKGTVHPAKIVYADRTPLAPLAATDENMTDFHPPTLPQAGAVRFSLKAVLQRARVTKNGQLTFLLKARERHPVAITFEGNLHPVPLPPLRGKRKC